MRIGLISDTHIPGGSAEVPHQVAQAFEGVDLILHSGNICNTHCLDWLEQIAPVRASGSIDRDGNLRSDPRVAEKQVVEVEGHTIGVVHDLVVPGMWIEIFPGYIDRYFPSGSSFPRALEEVFGKAVDIVVFGHTHRAMAEEHQGVLVVNPGSPTLRNQLRKIGHVATLELTPEIREVNIVDLAELS